MLLVKIPSNLGSLNKNLGTDKAPDALVKRLQQDMLNEQGMLPQFSVQEVEVDRGNIETTHQSIYTKARAVISQMPLFIGGDHSISYSLLKAFSESFDNPGAVIFDAHPDLMEGFTTPTHENYLAMLIENRLFKPENIVLVGLRNIHQKELNALEKGNLKHFSMKELSQETVQEVCDSVMSVAKDFGALYISIDTDVVDPAFAPGTGYREPGGLSSRELLYFLQRLKRLRNFKACDLVEINPERDCCDLTINLGTKIISELY